MLLIVWFYISLVAFLYLFLFYVELRARVRRHVKGSRSLPFITPASVDSLISIEPDLFMIELTSRADSVEEPMIPDAPRVPVSQLESDLRDVSQRSIFVFYDSATEPVKWSRVESIVNNLKIRNALILKGGLEMWPSKHSSDRLAAASCSTERSGQAAPILTLLE